jgi:hypothetical protein
MSAVNSWKSPWRECLPTFLQMSVQWNFLRLFGKVVIFKNTLVASRNLSQIIRTIPT